MSCCLVFASEATHSILSLKKWKDQTKIMRSSCFQLLISNGDRYFKCCVIFLHNTTSLLCYHQDHCFNEWLCWYFSDFTKVMHCFTISCVTSFRGPCFPIIISDGDRYFTTLSNRCMDFVRSYPVTETSGKMNSGFALSFDHFFSRVSRDDYCECTSVNECFGLGIC